MLSASPPLIMLQCRHQGSETTFSLRRSILCSGDTEELIFHFIVKNGSISLSIYSLFMLLIITLGLNM